MTLAEFIELFDECGIPIAFDHFKTEQSLPYLVYIVAANNQFGADNITYHSAPELQLELYTEQKDTSKEAVVENIISGFYFTKEEGYLASDQMYMVAYRFVLQ